MLSTADDRCRRPACRVHGRFRRDTVAAREASAPDDSGRHGQRRARVNRTSRGGRHWGVRREDTMNITKHVATRLAIRSLVVAARGRGRPRRRGHHLRRRPRRTAASPGARSPRAPAPMVAGPITNVRAGRHACYDRLVIDLKGKAPGYTVRYVSHGLHRGSGRVVPLRGGAKLLVVTGLRPTRRPARRATAGQPARAGRTSPATRRSARSRWAGSVRGPDLDRAGRAGAAAVPRLHDPRRAPAAASSSTSPTAGEPASRRACGRQLRAGSTRVGDAAVRRARSSSTVATTHRRRHSSGQPRPGTAPAGRP